MDFQSTAGEDLLLSMDQALSNQMLFQNLFQKPLSPGENSNIPQQPGSGIIFTDANRMSLFSLEKRIDYHLSRIMKGYRLVNFKNSIENLPSEKRICECIVEILMSSLNLISRKVNLINDTKKKAEELEKWASMYPIYKWNMKNGNRSLNEQIRQSYVRKLQEIKSRSLCLEQVIWALNSNKEHIKYVSKVFVIPDQYQRSQFSGDKNSLIPLKMHIVKTIEQCEEAITVCRIIRQQIHDSVVNTFLFLFFGDQTGIRPLQ